MSSQNIRLTSNFVSLIRLVDPGEALVVTAQWPAHLSVMGEAGRGRGCAGWGWDCSPLPPAHSPRPGTTSMTSITTQTEAIEGRDEVVLRRKVVKPRHALRRQLLKIGRDPVRRRLWPHRMTSEVVAGSEEPVFLRGLEAVRKLS